MGTGHARRAARQAPRCRPRLTDAGQGALTRRPAGRGSAPGAEVHPASGPRGACAGRELMPHDPVS